MSQRRLGFRSVRGALCVIAMLLAGCIDSGPVAPDAGGRLSRVTVRRLGIATCTAAAPGPSSCPNVSLAFSAYAPGDHFGADFQSSSGSGASGPITITFSEFVSSVTVTVEDPTYVGNMVEAFDEGGRLLQSVPVAYNNTPGINAPQTVNIAASGISRITLTPGANDYVAYSGLSFTAMEPCDMFRQPGDVNDPLLQDPYAQAILRDLAEQTHWNRPLGEQVEMGGHFGRDNTTGQIHFFPYNQFDLGVPPGPCLSGTTRAQLDSIEGAGYTIVGQAHTHPKAPFSAADPGNCYTIDPNARNPLVRQRGDANGRLNLRPGPSDTDLRPWRSGNGPGYPGYVIGPGRLDRWDREAGRLRRRTLSTNECVATGG